MKSDENQLFHQVSSALISFIFFESEKLKLMKSGENQLFHQISSVSISFHQFSSVFISFFLDSQK